MEGFFLQILGKATGFLLLSTPLWIWYNLGRVYRRYKLNQASKSDLIFQIIALVWSSTPLIIGIIIGLMIKAKKIS